MQAGWTAPGQQVARRQHVRVGGEGSDWPEGEGDGGGRQMQATSSRSERVGRGGQRDPQRAAGMLASCRSPERQELGSGDKAVGVCLQRGKEEQGDGAQSGFADGQQGADRLDGNVEGSCIGAVRIGPEGEGSGGACEMQLGQMELGGVEMRGEWGDAD